MKTLSEARCFDGTQNTYQHRSEACQCDMTFGLFLPPAARNENVPLLWFLAGLTCTHENAMTKAGAQYWAAKHGIAIAFPDTSPRGQEVADHEDFDLGQGAGFYVDAVQDPWARNFQMRRYITEELRGLMQAEFPIRGDQQGITGHSMGGHGALTLAMSMPEIYRSVSAFAPIANPTGSEWGRKQFAAYLGHDDAIWKRHDACDLMRRRGYPGRIIIDQGTNDPFADLLQIDSFANAAAERDQDCEILLRDGYDHGYFFVSTFMERHILHHAGTLSAC